MFCTHCGQNIVAENVQFCPYCGAPLNAPQQEEPQQPFYDASAPRPPYGAAGEQQPYGAPPPYSYPPYPPYAPPVSMEPADTWLKVACFFIPLLGIILYFVDRDKKPVSAKQCLKMSLIYIGCTVGLVLLLWLVMFVFMFAVSA